jgi:two-component system NtrC family sensor kinase
LLRTFADQAVIAIENVRLFNQLEARTRELSQSLDELRTAQDRLVQTEKLASLGQLTAGIAHEIKNPLSSGATVTMPSASDANQCCQMVKLGAIEPWNSLNPRVPPTPETAAPKAAAASNPRT